MKNPIEKKSSLLAVFGLLTLSLSGCSGYGESHNGLIPDIDGPSNVVAGMAASFSIRANNETDYPSSYGINWGDGSKPLIATNSSSSGISGDHAWAKPGNYTITATASDGHGESGFSTASIHVTGAPVPEPSSTESAPAPAKAQDFAPPLTVIYSDEPYTPPSKNPPATQAAPAAPAPTAPAPTAPAPEQPAAKTQDLPPSVTVFPPPDSAAPAPGPASQNPAPPPEPAAQPKPAS